MVDCLLYPSGYFFFKLISCLLCLDAAEMSMKTCTHLEEVALFNSQNSLFGFFGGSAVCVLFCLFVFYWMFGWGFSVGLFCFSLFFISPSPLSPPPPEKCPDGTELQ